MKTITINKGNWSGETTNLTYNEKTGEFTIAFIDYTFKLVPQTISTLPLDCYAIMGSGWDLPLGVVRKFEDTWYANTGWLEREDENPFVAAAQLLCNII